MIALIAAHPWLCLAEGLLIPFIGWAGQAYVKEALRPEVSQRNTNQQED